MFALPFPLPFVQYVSLDVPNILSVLFLDTYIHIYSTTYIYGVQVKILLAIVLFFVWP